MEIVDTVFDGNVKAAADAAGVRQPTLHRILSGEVREPKLSTLRQLADQFGIPLAWMTGEVALLPNESGTPEDRIPRWWNLLSLYHDRVQRDLRLWISLVSPKTEQGQRIVDMFAEFSVRERTRGFFFTLAGPAIHSGSPIPDSFQPAWRALLRMETEMVQLAARQLKAIGERPG
jgi:transcriptional regulator with XRE-family HTH domain